MVGTGQTDGRQTVDGVQRLMPSLWRPHNKHAQTNRCLPTERYNYSIIVFTARCTLVQSAVLRSHIVCLSVC